METSVGFAEMLVYSIVPITKDVAKKLEKALGIHTQFWLNFESIYQQDLTVVQHQHMKQDKKNRKNGF